MALWCKENGSLEMGFIKWVCSKDDQTQGFEKILREMSKGRLRSLGK